MQHNDFERRTGSDIRSDALAQLESRLARVGGCADATDVWAALGVADPAGVPGLAAEDFKALVARVEDHGTP